VLRRSLTLAVLALAVAAPAASACPGADEVPTAQTLPRAAEAVLCLVNEARVARGRVPLRWHPLLAFPETAYAQRMVRGRFFEHVAPNGQTLAQRLRYYRVDEADVGEVLAWGGPNRVTPRSALTMWLGSRVHRRVLLARRWRDAGVGPAIGSPFGGRTPSVTWAMAFGQPTPDLARRAAELIQRDRGR
jgi:uncharacterized protein YkwD